MSNILYTIAEKIASARRELNLALKGKTERKRPLLSKIEAAALGTANVGIGPGAKLPFTCGIVCTFLTFLRQSILKPLPQYDKMLIILCSHEALSKADPPPWIRMKPRLSWQMASALQRK